MRAERSMLRNAYRKEKPRLVLQERSIDCIRLPPRSGFSYQKLPPSLIKLSVRKLDGSSFDVHIGRTASVAELKQAVEDVFLELEKETQGNISWRDVWGHFCLCYNGRKLVNNKACIRTLGIKDGEQLHFVQHLSINNSPVKRRFKGSSAFCEQQNQQTLLTSGSRLGVHKEIKKKIEKDDHSYAEKENQRPDHFDEAFDGDLVAHRPFKLAHLVKKWVSQSKTRQIAKTRAEGKVHPWRLTGL